MRELLLITAEAIEGGYGWMIELATLLALVVFFNVFIGWLLKKLHSRFQRQHNLWKDAFVVAIRKPLSSFVWLIAFVQLINGFWERFSGQHLIQSPHAVIKIGLIITVFWFLFRWKNGVIHRLLEKSKKRELAFDTSKIDAINKVITLCLYFITTLLLIEQLGGSMNTLIAFGGVSGLAIAFASQQIISNFFGGMMIYFTQPFKIGDWIKIPEKDVEGHVEEIGWYTTQILSLDKFPIYIPNSILTNVIVMNPSRMTHRQIKETLGLRYEDLGKVPEILSLLRERIPQQEHVDTQYSPSIYLTAFNTHSIDIQVTAYTEKVDKKEFAEFTEALLLLCSRTIQECGADFAVPITGLEFPKGIPQLSKT